MKAKRALAPAGPAIEGGWMDTKTAAVYGQVNRKVLERAAKKRNVQSGELGGRYRFKAEHIDNWLQKRGFDGTITSGAHPR